MAITGGCCCREVHYIVKLTMGIWKSGCYRELAVVEVLTT